MDRVYIPGYAARANYCTPPLGKASFQFCLQQELVGYGAQQGENANLLGHSCRCLVAAPALCTQQNELALDVGTQHPGAFTSHHGFYTLPSAQQEGWSSATGAVHHL